VTPHAGAVALACDSTAPAQLCFMLARDPSLPAPPERPIPALSPGLCVKHNRSGACSRGLAVEFRAHVRAVTTAATFRARAAK